MKKDPRVATAVVIVAACAFLVGQHYFADRIGVWSEEVSIYPGGPNDVIVVGEGDALVRESCEGETRLRVSRLRPTLSLCAADRTWPILGAAYYSGWLYWPAAALLPPSVFVQRSIGLVFGLLTLLLGFVVARRLSDPLMAAAGALAAAFSSAFVIPHALLVDFETSQLPLVVIAALVLTRTPGGVAIEPKRAAVTGMFAGLALAANVKAVFLLFALALLAWRTRRLPAFDRTSRAAFGGALAAPLLPMLMFASADPSAGFSAQFGRRLGHAASRIASGSALTEPLNALTFWTDLAAYGDQAAGLPDATTAIVLILPALALGRITVHFGRAMVGRKHDPLAAALGALICVYILAAALLWDQQPAANYAPLHATFGFATGTSAVAFARWAKERWALSSSVGATGSVILVVAVCAGFGFHTYRRGDPARLSMSTNSVAQRRVVDHLLAAPGGTVVTLSYNLAGVIDSVSGGEVRATHAAPVIMGCVGDDDEAVSACVEERLGQLAGELGRMRVVLPVRGALSDEDRLSLIAPAFESLAAEGLIGLEREAAFGGVDTEPVLAIWDVRPILD